MKNIADIDPNMAVKDPDIEGITWYSPLNQKMFKAYGSEAFYEGDYARLSRLQREEVEKISPDVAFLSKWCAGLQLKFKTNSCKIMLDVTLRNPQDMNNMTTIAQCGFDIYVYDEAAKEFIFHNAGAYPRHLEEYRVELSLFNYFDKSQKEREFIINFPLYQGIKDVKIGLDSNSITTPSEYKNDGKIVIYGTSIAQGGCVSRPGLAYTNILSRWLDMEVYNQGYSGSAMLEAVMGDMIGQVSNPKLLVIDAEANAGWTYKMKDNLENFIIEYKKHHPNVPILLVSRCLFAADMFDEEHIKLREFYKEFVHNLIEKYRNLGYEMYFLDGDHFFDGYKFHFTEFTIDGVHPTDFGSYLMANHHFKAIKEILKIA